MKVASNVVPILGFQCQTCRASAPVWKSRCVCGAWNSLIVPFKEETRRRSAPASEAATAQSMASVKDDEIERVPSGIAELDRALGGGFVLGGIVLLCAEPGGGKSTLSLQAMASLARAENKTLYVSGEENVQQVASRARRLGLVEKNLFAISSGNLEEIFDEIDRIEPIAVVFDSIQTLSAQNLESPAGSISQLREVTSQIIDVCKLRDIAALIIGHVTKDGSVAGPRTLEHLVDAVFNLEGDRTHALRILRADKNRYASTFDVGIFEMTALGMREVPSPSAWLLAERSTTNPGSVVVAANEGVRGLLVEVQALVKPKGTGRKTVTGTEPARLGIVLAVLATLVPRTCDIFLNIAGGAKISEPGLDFGCAVAIVSSLLGLPVDPSCCVFGEIGLAGEVRGVGRSEARIAEASAMGFSRAIVPASVTVKAPKGLKIQKAKNVRHGIALALGLTESELLAKAAIVRKEMRKRT